MIMGQGYSFADPYRPVPVVRVGERCSRGVLEISDMVFSTRGSGQYFWSRLFTVCILKVDFVAPGAIVVEWNVGDPPGGRQAAVGAWDTHVR